ncbi:hypothetical protein ACGFWI_07660 [Streptomyces sp. NPDC048434]|uniref:hypothetical protein n=1 Tax=Streptomyces sp. NPDC048434 TaxID=3365549 RepID=UPI00371FB09A
MIMNDGQDESDVLTLALTAVGALGPCRAEAAYFAFGEDLTRTPAHPPHGRTPPPNLRAWAGPGRPDPYPKPEATLHEELLQEVARRLRPVRGGNGSSPWPGTVARSSARWP